MPFDKVETQVDFPAQERAVLEFWRKSDAFKQLRRKNQDGPRWSFLDGPITANNPMGVHHAWGRTYKDAYQRYHAMLGQRLRYQNGFDCQGLWVEVEVEKQLHLKSKRDIENLVPGDVFASVDLFVRECKNRVDKFAKVQSDQSIRLGYWMDWDVTPEDWAKEPGDRKSYFTMSEENNYTIWSFLKKCHDRKLVYRGYDAMPWCPRCGVGISQMEMNEGYRLVAHRAVFVQFPLRDRPGENLLAWTTTPWTLTSNVGAAVNPELTYLKVKQGDQVYYLGKGAFTAKRADEDKTLAIDGVPRLKSLEQLFKEKKGGFEVLGELKGADMVGWAYDGPFDEFPAQHEPHGYPEQLAAVVVRQKWAPAVSARDAHRVVAWKDVTEAEGTGIVHIAPGCGKEDFGLGKEQGLPPVAPLAEDGTYLPGFGPLTGQNAVNPEVAEAVVADLKNKGLLFATEQYPHRYPHCWRCKTELLYRLVDEWFIDMGWRDEISRVVDKIRWIPPEGQKQEQDWLKNMGDWMISKKRFWGLALPIWVDEVTGEFTVVGSREELKARAVEGWEQFEGHSPHRPWVDLVKIRNPKTGNRMSRVPDVGNPWLDAGIVPYSTMGYNSNRAEWEKWFPADFITECFPGQFRNWFYALLAMSTMLEQREPFSVLLGHALVRDQKGEEMHKGKGNSIPFDGAADTGYELFVRRDPKQKPEAQAGKELPHNWQGLREDTLTIDGKPVPALLAKYPPMSADVMRWMYCRNNPTQPINFGPETADDVRNRFVMKLWNVYAFFCNYARLDGFDPSAPQVPAADRSDLNRWVLSDLQRLIKTAREVFENYDVMDFCLEAEKFVDDKLSNWYVRRSRRRFWKGEKGGDKDAAYQTLYAALTTLTRLIAPVVPFLAETLYQNLVVKGDKKPGSGEPGYDVPASVHLTGYPVPDESLIDEQLSADMNALLDVVSLGSSARNAVKIKVRQPLAELRVQSANEAVRRAVQRFPDQIAEELNLKKVTTQDADVLKVEAKPNLRTLGSKFKAQLKDVQSAILGADPRELSAKVQKGEPFDLSFNGETFPLDPADVVVTLKAEEGWSGVADRDTQMALDARITDELQLEGMARDVVRNVQNLRKDANLEMEDRIELSLTTASAKLRCAIDTHREYIAGETLVRTWATSLEGTFAEAKTTIDKESLEIRLRKA